jgi:hypothetical protein
VLVEMLDDVSEQCGLSYARFSHDDDGDIESHSLDDEADFEEVVDVYHIAGFSLYDVIRSVP